MASKGTKSNPVDLGITPPPEDKRGSTQSKSRKTKDAATDTSKSSTNLTKTPASEHVLVSIRVTPEFRRELKATALDSDITVTQLIKDMYEYWKQNHS